MKDWRPSAAIERLQQRARLTDQVRRYFAAQGVLEITTPILACATTPELNVESFALNTPDGTRYLQTSPELFMKRLLAAGSGDIYQIGPAFRAHEQGRRHNPEFTLLEWYRVDFDYRQLMAEVETLITQTLANPTPALHLSYRAAFQRYAGLDPWTATPTEYAHCAAHHGLEPVGGLDPDGWLDLLLTQVVSPQFPKDRLTFLDDYPPSQAAQAVIVETPYLHAQRFEAYWGILELANGFTELTDALELKQRFEIENGTRAALGRPVVEPDTRLLAALTAGLPACAGVALGLDRLLMVAADVSEITQVMAFGWDSI